jgi:nitrate/TMAO reductase-like tetraheme cytochrome c subunit
MRAWGLRSLQVVLIFVPVGVAAAFLAMQTSSQPAFCGTCHIMKPYYESWKTSTHNDVPCVECHIPPGITAELQKKYEALSMVVKYFTGTYGTNPWAEISDEACLRPGCHEQRLLVGREVFKNVLFDHRPHLLEMRREKKLRCTSCHSQIVQGQHIAVTESTCFLCHFKETKLNEGTARCTLCHEIPEKLITTAGLSFDHADVKRLGMECTLCHNNVVKGDGDVPQERCYICHNDPARLARLGDVELLHRTHVTEHKVDCLNCHLEIQHKVPKELEIVATECQTCHVGGGHSPQRDLYVGIGGKGGSPPAGSDVSCRGAVRKLSHRLARRPQACQRRELHVLPWREVL